MNRKAQVPTILIAVIALVLSAVTLFALVSFKGGIESQSEAYRQNIEDLNFNHQYVLAQAQLIAGKTTLLCPNCSPEQLKEKYQAISIETENLFRFKNAGNFYGKIRNGQFEIDSGRIKVEGLFVESSQGSSSIKREFTLNLPLN